MKFKIQLYEAKVSSAFESKKSKKSRESLRSKFYSIENIVRCCNGLKLCSGGENWVYICLMIDLFNREIIGSSCGNKKDAFLVKKAIQSIPYSFQEIELFLTNRGKEFDNE